MVDRIKCIAFCEARDAGATFTNRQWVTDEIHCTTRFVREWWEKPYNQCFTDYHKLVNTSFMKQMVDKENVVLLCRRKIAERQREYVVPRTINNYRHREGLKSFHVILKPLKSENHISDRLWLYHWLKDWSETDFSSSRTV